MTAATPYESEIRKSYLVGFGHCVPNHCHRNPAVESALDLEPGWIERRTGFRQRRYCEEGQATGDLALEAARKALDQAGLPARQIGLVLLATSTPDHPLPGTAPQVAASLGIAAPAMDLMAACTGFLHGLELADAWVRSSGRPALLIAANKLSHRVNPEDPQTIGLFADAGAAVVLSGQPTPQNCWCIDDHCGGNQGQSWDQLYIPAGGSRWPLSAESIDSPQRFMKMESGRVVFKLAVESMQDHCQQLLQRSQLTAPDVRWLIPHQASHRIVAELGRRLKLQDNQIAWWLSEFGNSSAATIPLAMSLGIQQKKFSPNDRVLLAAAGAGMCSAASLMTVIA